MRQKRSVPGRSRKRVFLPDDREDEDLYAAVPEEESDDDLLVEEPDVHLSHSERLSAPASGKESAINDTLVIHKLDESRETEEESEKLPGQVPESADADDTPEEPEMKQASASGNEEAETEKGNSLPLSNDIGQAKKWSGEWIDQKFNSFVDDAVIRVPAFFRLTGIRIARSHAGWHIWLVLVSLRNAIGSLLVHFRSEDDMDLFLDDTAESLGDRFSALKSIIGRQMNWLVAIDMAGERIRFAAMLFFIALSSCGCAVIGTWELASLAFFFCTSWLATAFDLSYKPVIGRLRQVYIVARLLSALSMLVPAIMYYIHYRDRGVANNMMLQGMLIFMLLTHLVLFTVMILPNRQQSSFLRALSGILGIIPSLLVANAVSYSATLMGMGFSGFIGGILRIFGVVLLFVGDRIESLRSLGALRFKFSELLMSICNLFGCMLLLIPAWVFRV